MTPGVAVRSLRAFRRQVLARGQDSFDVGFYGGEPLLNRPVIEAVIEEAGAPRGPATGLILNTNATLLDPPMTALLASAGVHVHVSLDGPDEASNSQRRTAGGRPSWTAVLRSLTALKNAGISPQINSTLTGANIARLEGLIEFAAGWGCRRLYLALPDGPRRGPAGLGSVELARRLVELRSSARRSHVDLFGPWTVAAFPPRPSPTCPPLNIVVLPDGRAFFPHLPRTVFPSVTEAFASERDVPLWARWRRVLRSCRSCPLWGRCRGYIKMMVRYHTGSLRGSARQCGLAVAAGRMMREERYRPLRTALDICVAPAPRGEVEIRPPMASDEVLVASRDVVEIIDWFRAPGDLASLEKSYVSEDLGEAVRSLVDKRVLVDAERQTDASFFAALTSRGRTERRGPITLGARGSGDLDRLKALGSLLERARGGLPPSLRDPFEGFFVFGASGPDRFSRVLAMAGQPTALPWMAGTVVLSLVLLELDQVHAIMSHDGRRRNALFLRQLRHEFAHVALRKAGLRLPLWLEEGFCELLSGAPTTSSELGLAYPEARRFVEFATACHDPRERRLSPATSLLEFSVDPPDVNPGYILSRDFVGFCSRAGGIESLIGEFRNAGLTASLSPFPLAGARDPLLGRSLSAVLSAWLADLARRAPSEVRFERPLRVVATGTRFLIYDRIHGGFHRGALPRGFPIAKILHRNLRSEDVASLLGRPAGPSSPSPAMTLGSERRFSRPPGIHLRLSLNDACNMACRYCYEPRTPAKAMSRDVADKAVRAWRDFLLADDIPRSTVRLFGGEPFLNWPVMRHVLNTAEQGLPPGEVSWIINTNGTLLERSWLPPLERKGKRLTVVVSCDGVGATHDAARPMRDGRGSFAEVARTIRTLASAGIPVCVAAVVGRHNAEGLEELARWVAGLKRGSSAPLSLDLGPMIAHEDSRIPFSTLRDRVQGAIEICRGEGVPVSCQPLSHAFDEMRRPGGASGRYCGITGREISVASDGRLIVCHAIPGSVYGRIEDLEDSETIPLPAEIEGRGPGNIAGCEGCEIEGLCGGGCAAQSAWTAGHARERPGGAFCEWMIEGFRQSVASLLLE